MTARVFELCPCCGVAMFSPDAARCLRCGHTERFRWSLGDLVLFLVVAGILGAAAGFAMGVV